MAMTHAELAARLLRDAADFFLSIGAENPALKEQMDENARVFNGVADMVQQDPNGVLEDEG